MESRHILVVDDEQDYASLVAAVLGDEGFRVSTAAESQEALRILDEDPADLVVTDVMMGHLSEGFDLVRAVRRGRATGPLPVIILSAVRDVYDAFSQVGESWLECDAFLDKPVSPQRLVETVIRVLAEADRAHGRVGIGRSATAGTVNRRPRALVVEDSPDFAHLLGEQLGDGGFKVDVASDGAEALEKLQEATPDVITLDIQMPNKGGVELFRELKADERSASIPVVVVTGISADSPDMERFVRTLLETEHLPLPDAYLEKPVAAETLLQVVGDAIRSLQRR